MQSTLFSHTIMNTHKKTIIQVAALALGFLASTPSVYAAGTWTAAPATPPTSNVEAPINVGSASQSKAGVLGVTGFANFGRAELLGYTHIGAYPCGTGCTGGAPATDPGGSTTAGGTVGYMGGPTRGNMLLGNVFASLGSSFKALLSPNTAYALDLSGATTGGATGGGGGGGGTSGGGTTYGGGATMVYNATVTFTATPASISTGGSSTLSYTVSNAASCTVTSSNASNNWNTTFTPSGGSASGSQALGTFSSQGSYSYTMTCTSNAGGTNGVGTATVTVGPSYIFQVDGNTRMNGYLDTIGGISSTGTIKQGGVPVCLQNGTNCVSGLTGTEGYVARYGASGALQNSIMTEDGGNRMSIGALRLKSDQGGSIELGDNGTSPNGSGNVPYIDFHNGNGTAQDYNVRVINNGDGVLSFENESGTMLSIRKDSQSVSVRNSVPMYRVDATSCNAVSAQNSSTASDTSGISGVRYFGSYTFPLFATTTYRFCYISGAFVQNTLLGYLLPPPTPVPSVTTGSYTMVSQAVGETSDYFDLTGSVSSGYALDRATFEWQNTDTGASGSHVITYTGGSTSFSYRAALACHATYNRNGRFRLTATSSSGTGYGNWVAFSIPRCR